MSRGDSWIFRAACGCAFGLADLPQHATEENAWRAMYNTARERDVARRLGVTAARETTRHNTYDELRGAHRCGRQPAVTP